MALFWRKDLQPRWKIRTPNPFAFIGTGPEKRGYRHLGIPQISHDDKTTSQDLAENPRAIYLGVIMFIETMPTDATIEATRREWRELGFFYDRNDQQKVWRLMGSRSGLLRFRDALLEYAEDPSNDYESEHKHYGPYLYLEVMTWPEPGFDDHAIRGSLPDLKRLAAIVDARLTVAHPGETICIREEFAANSSYALILEVRGDDFDPAQADPTLPKQV